MDPEFLGTRLAAAEAAVLKIDERIDAQPDLAPALAALVVEIETLREGLAECQNALSSLQTSQSEATETTAEIAEAEADQAEAEATEAIAEVLETVLEMETEEEPEMGIVEEIAPEPEPESDTGPETSSGNWLERLLALK